MNSEREVVIRFGALAPPLSEQLSQEGVWLDPVATSMRQRDADAITRLHMHGLLTEREARAARKRLMKRILKRSVTNAPSTTGTYR